MNLARITRLRARLAIFAAVLCVLSVLSGIDGAIAYLREPFNSLRLLPGESARLTGPSAPGAVNIDQLTYESTSPSLTLAFEEIISGFWMGGKMWRGKVSVGPETGPGAYLLSVYGKQDGKKLPANVFQVFVYKDREAYLADSRSVVLRLLGISPWALAASLFALVVFCCLALYFISGKRDRLMAEIGEAEVYHINNDDLGYLIYFGLGAQDGLNKGDKLLLLDRKGNTVGETVVDSVSETDASARLGTFSDVRPGYRVRKI